ncbi:hypothetical protein [Nocardioides ferulae]|uniref:hypothetical protein n=1 Tax=Nocardioides ferulae TaxID=2340821 RepID=UPI000EB08564|nr:hypothetical protein [Nocardioides ferulae]
MDVVDVVIWIVVGLVLVALVAGLVLVMRKRKQERQARDHARAQELRREAAAQTPQVTQSQLEAREAAAQADLARAEAERAERRAAEAKQGLRVEEARQEDAIREADRLDPHVDHRADDYQPGATGAPTDTPEADRTDITADSGTTSTETNVAAPPAPRSAPADDQVDEPAGGKHRGAL